MIVLVVGKLINMAEDIEAAYQTITLSHQPPKNLRNIVLVKGNCLIMANRLGINMAKNYTSEIMAGSFFENQI